jgi:ribosomal protein S12
MDDAKYVSKRRAYPNVKVEVLVCDRLDVKAYRGYRGHNLADLDEVLVQQGQACLRERLPTFSLYSNVVFPALSYAHL